MWPVTGRRKSRASSSEAVADGWTRHRLDHVAAQQLRPVGVEKLDDAKMSLHATSPPNATTTPTTRSPLRSDVARSKRRWISSANVSTDVPIGEAL